MERRRFLALASPVRDGETVYSRDNAFANDFWAPREPIVTPGELRAWKRHQKVKPTEPRR